jgi:hypothetical protein
MLDHVCSTALREHAANHFAIHVCQTEITPAIPVRQARAIEAEQVENGRVQIIDMHRILGRAMGRP